MKSLTKFLPILLLVILASCGKDEDPKVCDPSLLQGTNWEIYALGPVDTPTLILPMVIRGSIYLDTANWFAFYDGCNIINGHYTALPDCSFTLHPESSTIAGCIPYPVIRNTRGEVLHPIRKAKSFEILNLDLILQDSLGQETRWEKF